MHISTVSLPAISHMVTQLAEMLIELSRKTLVSQFEY